MQRLRTFLDERALKEQDEELVYYTYELGVGGDDTCSLLDRFHKEMEARYEPGEENIVIFQIGENDHIHSTETGETVVERREFRENIEDLIGQAREFTSNVFFVGAFPHYPEFDKIPYSPEWSVDNERKRDYEEVKKEVCQSKGVPYIDLSGIADERDTGALVEDGLHPNNEGHRMVYEMVRDRLEKESLI